MAQNKIKHFMVVFDLSMTDLEAVYSLVPAQQQRVDELFVNGKLLSYSLSNTYDKLWAVFMADSESELVMLIDTLPVTPYMDYTYHQLMFNQSLNMIPSVSLN